MISLIWFSAGVLACFLIALAVYKLFLYPEYLSPLRDLPGPKDHHLFIGQHLNQYRTGDPEEPYMTWMRKWQKEPMIRYYEFMHGDAFLINNPAVYRSVMHDNAYTFVRSTPFRRLIGDIIGEGLVFAEGNVHRAQRRALGGLFTNKRVRDYVPQFSEKALDLVLEVKNQTETDKNAKVDIKALFADATLDIIGIFAFGFDMAKMTDKRKEFVKCYNAMFDLTPGGMLLAAVNLLLPVRWLPFKDNKVFMDASAKLRRIMTDMVDARIDEMALEKASREDSGPLDMLTYMVDNKYEATNDPWTKADLVEQALNFLATGHETTAGALTFTVHLLGQHPEVVKKMRAEFKNASINPYDFDKRGSDGAGLPDFNKIDSLVYLDHVLKEALRMLPPVAGIPRVATKDLVICDQLIPKGTTVMPVPAVIHHNPAIWGPDADEFRPERWDQPAGGAVGAEYFAWVGFGHGPRACIGRALAALNVKIVLIQLVTHFDFQAVHSGKVPVVNPSGQIRPNGPVEMFFQAV